MDNPFGKEPTANPFGGEDTTDPSLEASTLTPEEQAAEAHRQQVLDAYDKMPWYDKRHTATIDIAHMVANGLTLNALDSWLGPDAKAHTADAWTRAGLAGYPAEVAGALYSPITRLVGAGANMIRPAASGLLPWLGKLGVSGLEGGTLGGAGDVMSGDFKSVPKDAATGAVLGTGANLVGGIVPKLSKFVASWLSGKDPDAFSAAYQAGKAGGAADTAFNAAQNVNKFSTPTKDAATQKIAAAIKDEAGKQFQSAQSRWSNATVNHKPVIKEWNNITKEMYTPAKEFRGNANTQANYSKIKDLVSGFVKKGSYTIQDFDALRQQIKGFVKNPNNPTGMIATRLQKVIKSQVEKVQPGYIADLANYGKGKVTALDAAKAGKELAPKLSRSISMGQLGVLTPLALAGGSPRVNGILANLAGKGARYTNYGLKALTGAPPSYGKMGLIANFNKDLQ
jgi:hypothetical protein